MTQRDVWAHWDRGRALPPSRSSSRSTTAIEALLGPLCRTCSRSWPGVLNLTVKSLRVSGGLTDFDVRTLISSGWELASHTLTHPDLTTPMATALTREVTSSRKVLRARFGVPIDFSAIRPVIRRPRDPVGSSRRLPRGDHHDQGLADQAASTKNSVRSHGLGGGVAGRAQLGAPRPADRVEARVPRPAPRRRRRDGSLPRRATRTAGRSSLSPPAPGSRLLRRPSHRHHGESRQFHSASTSPSERPPVYATLTGRAYIHPLHDTRSSCRRGTGSATGT